MLMQEDDALRHRYAAAQYAREIVAMLTCETPELLGQVSLDP